jgi:hypothetical protein
MWFISVTSGLEEKEKTFHKVGRPIQFLKVEDLRNIAEARLGSSQL